MFLEVNLQIGVLSYLQQQRHFKIQNQHFIYGNYLREVMNHCSKRTIVHKTNFKGKKQSLQLRQTKEVEMYLSITAV